MVDTVDNEVVNNTDVESVEKASLNNDVNVSNDRVVENTTEVAETEKSTEETTKPEVTQAKENETDGMLKRLARQERRHKREMQEQQAQMQVQFANVMQNFAMQNKQPDQWQMPPMTDQNRSVEEKVQEAVVSLLNKQKQEQMKIEEMEKNRLFTQQEEQLLDKYEDYEEVLTEAKPYLTREMVFALRELPEGSLENLYSAWKENPEQLKKISTLSPVKQALEIARLDATYSAKKTISKQDSTKSYQQVPSNQLLKPIQPRTNPGRVNKLDQDFNAMIADYNQKINRR